MIFPLTYGSYMYETIQYPKANPAPGASWRWKLPFATGENGNGIPGLVVPDFEDPECWIICDICKFSILGFPNATMLSEGDGLGFPCYPKATVWGSRVIQRRRFGVPMLSKDDGLGFPCYPKTTVSSKPSPGVIVKIHQIHGFKYAFSPLMAIIPVVVLVQKGHLWYLRKLMFTKATVSMKPSPLTIVPYIEK